MTGLKMPIYKTFPIVLILAILAGCTGEGILAVVAISAEIDEGKLPEGLSAGRVLHIAPDAVTDDYLFVSTGPAFLYKNINDIDGLWQKTRLISGGTEWDGIQSMVASGNRIIMALYKVNSEEYTVALHALTAFNPPNATITPITGAVWTSTISPSSIYQTIRLYCPVPAGDIYVNVMNHLGEYGSLDTDNVTGFIGSSLYILGNSDTSFPASPEPGFETYLNGTPGRYVSGVAIGGGKTRITATNLFFSVYNGILMDENGGLVPNPHSPDPDGSISLGAGVYSNVSATGITWLPGANNDLGAFIMSGVSLYNGRFPVFASADGISWRSLPGTSTDYLTTNFVDVSGYTAGQSDFKEIVLAGTSSYIDGSTSYIASGYNEIDVSGTIDTWTVLTNWDDYDLALKNNYSVSDLAQATITGMSVQIDGLGYNYLFASTRFEGLWRLYLDEDYPSWTRE
jgi:hypothetical protein